MLPERPSKFDGLWLSVSKAKTFDDCQAKFKFAYIEKLPRKTWSFHTLGSFAHRVLELFQEARLKGEDMPDNDLMTLVFNEAAKEFKPDLKADQKKTVFDMALQYLQILDRQRKEGTGPKVIGVERNFYINIGDEILLNGMIDLEQIDQDGLLHLADYKTTKSARYLKKDFFQLLTYAYVKCVEDPTIARVRCSYILLRHGFDHLTKEFDRDEVMKIQDKLLDYAKKIKSEKLYRANPTRLCEYCDFVSHCSEGREFIGEKTSVANYGAGSWG